MRGLQTTELLELWERGARTPAERSGALLAAARPELAGSARGALTVGEGDAAVLELREATFGPRLEGFAECPACGERLEFALDSRELRVDVEEGAGGGVEELTVRGYRVGLRPLTGADLQIASADGAGGVEDMRAALLERAVVSAELGGTPLEAGALPEEVVAAVSARLGERDPQAELLVELACPMCDEHWEAPLDIGSFFWTELAALARQLLADVAALASAYGWCEADILALTGERRRAYLELAR